MADPLILIDYEFGFTNGDVITPQHEFQAGRDSIETRSNGDVILRLQPDDHTTETIEVMRDKLNYKRIIRREVKEQSS